MNTQIALLIAEARHHRKCRVIEIEFALACVLVIHILVLQVSDGELKQAVEEHYCRQMRLAAQVPGTYVIVIGDECMLDGGLVECAVALGLQVQRYSPENWRDVIASIKGGSD